MRAEGSEFYCYDSLIVNGMPMVLSLESRKSSIRLANSPSHVAGKGRVHCRQPGFEKLNGLDLDEKGCIQPQGLPDEKCSPSDADYEVSTASQIFLHPWCLLAHVLIRSLLPQVIETDGQQYLMLNLLNSGFEHSVKVGIDGHEMIVVANDGGFVEPYTTHVSCSGTT